MLEINHIAKIIIIQLFVQKLGIASKFRIILKMIRLMLILNSVVSG